MKPNPSPAGHCHLKLRRLRWWEQLLIQLSPARRRDYERSLAETMRWLVEHPEVPVEVER
jgi:hypothetical protein